MLCRNVVCVKCAVNLILIVGRNSKFSLMNEFVLDVKKEVTDAERANACFGRHMTCPEREMFFK